MAKINTLHEFLVEQLRDLYSAETQILANLPTMAKQTSHPDLRMAFEAHVRETEQQKERLERIATQMNFSPGGHTCAAMQGIAKEAQQWLAEAGTDDVRDAGLIANAQRVEHYEIAGYGTARAIAERLGLAPVVALLEQTLQEEKATDQKLTRLALSSINEDAATNRSR
ncbi:MAG TPA: ferritin-like domain-containing protein [Tepidisphaeraceae bacterium]